MRNVSYYPVEVTANTKKGIAEQRAENLDILNATNVIELCCGPSLSVLGSAYNEYDIKVTGNDIDPRYEGYAPDYPWLIGDCFEVDTKQYDFIVFAPPLSKGCSGRREDSLSIFDVTPSYLDALDCFKDQNLCLTLPGKSLSTSKDRAEFYKLLSLINRPFEVVLLKQKVTKYIDIYIRL